VIAITLSLCCSLSWGCSDFLGGWLGRRMPLLTVLSWSQGTSLCIGLAIALAFGGAPPLDETLLVALGAGVCSVAGVAALYRALSIGHMGVVAPIAATSALAPVLVGLAIGDRPSALQAVGMAVALAGVITTSRESRKEPVQGADRRAIGYALLAALAFGLVQILLAAGAGESVPWTIGGMRAGSVATLVVFALVVVRRQAVPPPAPASPAPASSAGSRGSASATVPARPRSEGARAERPIGLLLLTGALDMSAATFYAAATTHGLRSVVAVLGSLYPVVTVLLASVLLHERLARHQQLGAAATLAGVVAVAAG
jgi:drug/metabolite transporter (DMT)-like permease